MEVSNSRESSVTKKRERIPRERVMEKDTSVNKLDKFNGNSGKRFKDVEKIGGMKRARVNRENVCPCLIRIFIKYGEAHREEEYIKHDKLPKNELAIHAWKDSTLREITELLKQSEPKIREWGSRVQFSIVFADQRGKYLLRNIGSLDSHRNARDDFRTLDELHFQVGDFLAISIVSEQHQEPKADS